MMNSILLNISIFCYLYSPNIGIIKLKYIIFAISTIYLCYNKRIRKYIFYPILFFVFQIMYSIFLGFINLNFEKMIYMISLANILNVIISYFIVELVFRAEKDKFIKTLVNVFVFQSILMLLMYLFKPLGEIILKITVPDIGLIEKMKIENRIVGLGAVYFFGGAALQGCGLLIIGCFTNKKTIKMDTLKALILIFTGIGMARTMFVSIFLFFLILIMRFKLLLFLWNIIKNKIVIVTLVTITIFWNKIYASNEKLIRWATDFLTGKRDPSLERLKTMYVYPDNIYTWLLGDSKLFDGDRYYMHTDVGYLRIIFAIGFVGLLIYFFIPIFLALYTSKQTRNKQIKLLMKFLIIYALILNLKGMIDLTYIVLLFYFYVMKIKNNSLRLGDN